MAGFGGAVKLTGESEYRKALNQITQNLKEVSAQMKLVSSSYDKNDKSVEALTAKEKVLNLQFQEQTNKLDTLKSQYQAMQKQYTESSTKHGVLVKAYELEKTKLEEIGRTLGTSSKEYQAQRAVVEDMARAVSNSSKNMDANAKSMGNMRVQMLNAQTDVNRTAKELDNLGKEAEESGKQADEASKGGWSMFKQTLADLQTKAIQGVISGLKKLGGQMINIGKQAYSNYASYEQLVGGVQTLFGESSDKLIEYAQKAYKTAGVSANEYMEQATSFSATLLQGLQGDTEKAVEYADMAIKDMADNANKMGTSMYMIQNAYQGFAKDNYTMLDNLKLGYGGTQSEMARLINDSGVLGDTVKVTAKTVKDVPFDKIIEAIHKTQQEIGITGTTTKEAEKTIEGSTKAMASAWQNLLTGIADEKQDISPLLEDLVTQVVTAGANMLPRIKEIIKGMGEAITTVWNDVIPKLAEQIPELQPIVDALNWVKDNASYIISGIAGIVGALAGFKAFTAISSVVGVFTTLFNTVKTGTPIMQALNVALNANPIGLIVAGVTALVTAFITLWNTSEDFRNFWIGLWENIQETFSKAWEAVSEGLTNAWNNITEGFETAKQSVIDAWGNVSAWFGEQWDNIKTAFSNVGTFFSEKFTQAKDGVINAFKSIPEWFKNTFTKAWENVKNVFSTGGKIFDGIKEGIANAFKTIVNAIIKGINKVISVPFNAINKMLDKIRNVSFLGISPFKNLISQFNVPQIPLLARGGVLGKGQIGLLEGSGAEAVVPLENNAKWIKKVAKDLRGEIDDPRRTVSNDNIVKAFKQALSEMKIELDDEVAGKFVERTVANAVFA